MTTYKVQPEMQWRPEPDIDAARKLPGWAAFHRICGQQRIYFDHPVRDGRKGFTIACFTLEGRVPVALSTGRGASVVLALVDAHDRCGRGSAETAAALAVLVSGTVATVDPFADLLGDDFEGMLE